MFVRAIISFRTDSSEASISGELSPGRLLYILKVSEIRVDSDEELGKGVVEFAREQPFV